MSLRQAALASILAAWGALAPSPVRAAERGARRYLPLLQVRYWYTDSISLSDPDQPEELALRGHTLRVAGLLGHRFQRSRTTLMAALRYDATFLAARQGTGPERQDTLHAPFLRLGVIQGLNERFGLMAYGLVGVASDMEDLTLGDTRLTVGAGAIYEASSKLRIVFGVMYTTAFVYDLPLPLFNLRYRTGPVRLQILIPKGSSVWVALGRRLELGLVAGVLNLRYGLHDDARFADELGALNITAGPAARLYLYRGVFLQGEGGYNVRFFRIRRQDAVTYQLLTFRGWYTSFALGYML